MYEWKTDPGVERHWTPNSPPGARWMDTRTCKVMHFDGHITVVCVLRSIHEGEHHDPDFGFWEVDDDGGVRLFDSLDR